MFFPFARTSLCSWAKTASNGSSWMVLELKGMPSMVMGEKLGTLVDPKAIHNMY